MFFEQLICPVRHYAWGERATDKRTPLIPSLLNSDAGDLPWAELWIGAHPSGSAVIKSTGEPLAKLIQENPQETIGLGSQSHASISLSQDNATSGISQRKMPDANNGIEEGGLGGGGNAISPSLPFLLKILCCSAPLSIQSHPDKATAAKLHTILPKEFPDANHKPEALLALSDFRLMAGFRPPKEIVADLEGSPALRPWRKALAEEPSLEELTRFVLEANSTLLQSMAEQYCLEEHPGIQAEQFRILQEKYPGDCGVFFALLLNVFILKPGEAVFVQANVPHAYLDGQGIECMANSDNVIRAGLTPKYINRKLLLSTLDFTPRPPSLLRVPTSKGDFDFTCGDDFRLRLIQTTPYTRERNAPAIFIVLEGRAAVEADGKSIVAVRGTAWFAPASIRQLRIIPGTNAKIAWAET